VFEALPEEEKGILTVTAYKSTEDYLLVTAGCFVAMYIMLA